MHINTHTHKHTQSTEETFVAIKTCKPDSTPEERAKFLQEAGQNTVHGCLSTCICVCMCVCVCVCVYDRVIDVE